MSTPALGNDDPGMVAPTCTQIDQAASTSPILHRHIHHEPPTVIGGSGLYYELEGGTKVLDASGGAAVACIGHGNSRVREAVNCQQPWYVHSSFFKTRVGEDLGRELVDSTKGHMPKVAVYNSGSEAMEAVIKLARQFHLEKTPPQPSRCMFIAREGSYHGATMGALSMGGHRFRRAPFEPMLLNSIGRVSACNAYRGMKAGETEGGYVARLANELDEEFQRLGPENVCAFVAEPVVGAALGCVPPVRGYFQAMKMVCDKYGALLILDEVMCGMGRTGTLHAWEQEGVVPDIQTLGKGLGGGYQAVAAVLIGHRVVNALENNSGAFRHGQTYQSHPISCTAALEVQRIIREENLVANVREMGVLLSKLLKQRLTAHPHVGDIRGRGLFWGIEFVRDKVTKEPFGRDEGIAMQVHEKALQSPYAICLYPGNGTADGESGDHILLAPPYNVTEEQIREIVSKTVQVIEDFFAGPGLEDVKAKL